MGENTEVRRESDYLYIRSSTPMSRIALQDFIDLVQNNSKRTNTNKVIVDARKVQGHITTMERFFFASELAEHLRGLKVAFVIQAPKIDPDRFGETVAVNRGGNILVFESMEEAYQWLEVMPVKDANN
jgi:hypothetical protein